MSELMAAIKMLLSNSWKFFQIKVPGTGFSFAVLAVCLLLVPISLSFLSLILGFPVGTADRDTGALAQGQAAIPGIFRPEKRCEVI